MRLTWSALSGSVAWLGEEVIGIKDIGAGEWIAVVVLGQLRAHHRLDVGDIAFAQRLDTERPLRQVPVGRDDLAGAYADGTFLHRSRPEFQERDVSLQVGARVGIDGMVADQLDEQVAPEAGRFHVFLAARYSSEIALNSGLQEGRRSTVRRSRSKAGTDEAAFGIAVAAARGCSAAAAEQSSSEATVAG